MNAYTINEIGQDHVTKFVVAYGKDGLNADAFFDDADRVANDAFDIGDAAHMEMNGQYSYDGRPHILTLDQTWFDAQPIEV